MVCSHDLVNRGHFHDTLHDNQRADINTMHASLSSLRVEERLIASLLVFIINIYALEIPNCLQTALTHTHLPQQTCHQGSFHSPQVQNKFKETYSIIQSHECLGLPSFSYSAGEQQTWFKTTDKATPHGTTPLPHVTYLLCVCTDMYV